VQILYEIQNLEKLITKYSHGADRRITQANNESCGLILWDEVIKETKTLNCFNIILFAIFITVFLVLLLMGHTLQNEEIS
jgi:hypothetical protein